MENILENIGKFGKFFSNVTIIKMIESLVLEMSKWMVPIRLWLVPLIINMVRISCQGVIGDRNIGG